VENVVKAFTGLHEFYFTICGFCISRMCFFKFSYNLSSSSKMNFHLSQLVHDKPSSLGFCISQPEQLDNNHYHINLYFGVEVKDWQQCALGENAIFWCWRIKKRTFCYPCTVYHSWKIRKKKDMPSNKGIVPKMLREFYLKI